MIFITEISVRSVRVTSCCNFSRPDDLQSQVYWNGRKQCNDIERYHDLILCNWLVFNVLGKHNTVSYRVFLLQQRGQDGNQMSGYIVSWCVDAAGYSGVVVYQARGSLGGHRKKPG